MHNQQLLDYINQQLTQGVSKETINSNLLSQGWQQADVNEAFFVADSQDSIIPQASFIPEKNKKTAENQQIKQKFPVGMIIILIIIELGIALNLRSASIESPYWLGPFLISGGVALFFIKALILGVPQVIFFGILKRLKWARKLAIGWYSLFMATNLITVAFIFVDNTLFKDFFLKSLPPEQAASLTPGVINSIITISLITSTGIGLIIPVITVIYLAKKKDFFVN